MTVIELIEKLKAFEPTAEVLIHQVWETGGEELLMGISHRSFQVILTDEELENAFQPTDEEQN